MSVARAIQQSAQDDVRWGDRVTLEFGNSGSGVTLSTAISRSRKLGKQLVNTRWRWPLSWQTLFVLVPNFPSDETTSLSVTFNVTIGCGAAEITFPNTYVIAPSGGVYFPVFDTTLRFPAQDIQVELTSIVANGENVITTASRDTIDVFAGAAPETEPHAVTHLLDHCCNPKADERQDGWMPPGFAPEPLGYRR